MSTIIPRDTVTHAERGREFWRRRLLAGAFTALPRWTRDRVPGVGEHEAWIGDEVVAALRRLADELAVSLSSVWLTAHAKPRGTPSQRQQVAGLRCIALTLAEEPAQPGGERSRGSSSSSGSRLAAASRTWKGTKTAPARPPADPADKQFSATRLKLIRSPSALVLCAQTLSTRLQ